MTPTAAAAATTTRIASVPPAPFLAGGRGGALAIAGRPDGRTDAVRGSTRSGTLATGDSREVRGGSDSAFLGCPGDIPATIARARAASAAASALSLGASDAGLTSTLSEGAAVPAN